MTEDSRKVYTIGFTKKSAKDFFGLLEQSETKRVIDVRLNNASQLAGFAKRKDLEYFLQEILDIDYVHLPELAPTKAILDAYKKHKGAWNVYEDAFIDLMKKREIEKRVDPQILTNGCLLCSEDKPHHCHRRLVTEYLQGHWGNLNVRHLL
jgi:uncharacterized protein (DUF488 family)